MPFMAVGETDDEDLSGQPNFIDLDRLSAHDVDYVALGDWHGFVHAGGKAWFFKLRMADKSELGGLMDEAAYKAYCDSL